MSNAYFEQLVSARFDVAAPPAAVPRVLLICTTPRTAGHAVCDAMRRRGWGVPTEYFLPDYARRLGERWLGLRSAGDHDFAEPAAYGRELLAKRTAGGVFSAKLFPLDLAFCRSAVPVVDAPSTAYVYLVRGDIVAQVVSLAAVLHTGRAFDGDLELQALRRLDHIDAQALVDIARFLGQQSLQWQRFFATRPPGSVRRLATPAFLANPDAALDDLARHFGLPAIDIEPGSPASLPDLGAGAYAVDRQLKADIAERFAPVLARIGREAEALSGHFRF